MRLSDLARICGAHKTSSSLLDIDVEQISTDAGTCVPSSVFVALLGRRFDGHDFITQAIKQGAVAIVSERMRMCEVPSHVVWIRVPHARMALAYLLRAFYRLENAKIAYLGVTGTCGKTTTTYLCEHILKQKNPNVALLGTNEQRFLTHRWPSTHTTMEATALAKQLNHLTDLGAQEVVMEVSSHGLADNRVHALSFDVGAFLNLSHEHLDFHGHMRAYFDAKSKLFSECMSPSGVAVIAVDDEAGVQMCDHAKRYVKSLSVSTQHAYADVTVSRVVQDSTQLIIDLQTPFGSCSLQSPMVGTHNAQNVAVAATMALLRGATMEHVHLGISECVVPGRLQRVVSLDKRIGFVDYAHKPEALKRVLIELKKMATHRLFCVIGCGGDRDQDKRPLMAAVACEYADVVILTSDNPRSEDPAFILAQMQSGIPSHSAALCQVVEDRREAIGIACSMMNPFDIILVAGKGHETYQIIGNQTIDFDDVLVLNQMFLKTTPKNAHEIE